MFYTCLKILFGITVVQFIIEHIPFLRKWSLLHYILFPAPISSYTKSTNNIHTLNDSIVYMKLEKVSNTEKHNHGLLFYCHGNGVDIGLTANKLQDLLDCVSYEKNLTWHALALEYPGYGY